MYLLGKDFQMFHQHFINRKNLVSFEPVIGENYYLYTDKSNQYFLSLINPESWNKECIGEFTLNSEGKWLKSI